MESSVEALGRFRVRRVRLRQTQRQPGRASDRSAIRRRLLNCSYGTIFTRSWKLSDFVIVGTLKPCTSSVHVPPAGFSILTRSGAASVAALLLPRDLQSVGAMLGEQTIRSISVVG